jgi:hypothetical protein
MYLDKKLGEKLVKVFGVEDLLSYLSIGNDKCGFCVWNYCVLFSNFFYEALNLRSSANKNTLEMSCRRRKCTTMVFKLSMKITKRPSNRQGNNNGNKLFFGCFSYCF